MPLTDADRKKGGQNSHSGSSHKSESGTASSGSKSNFSDPKKASEAGKKSNKH